MRIVHVITGLHTGGAEAMLEKLLAFQQQADTVRVVSLTTTGPVGTRLRARGMPVTALGMKRGRASPVGLVRLVRLLSQDEPDLVQTWMYHADLLGGIAARMLHIPVVWGVRHECSGTDRALTRLTRRLCAFLSWWIPESVVFNSESALRSHAELGYARAKLLVVPNGFDLSRFQPNVEMRGHIRRDLGIGETTPVVGLAARYHADKDHETFIAAAARIRGRCESVQFVLCGEGISWDNGELASALDRAGLRPAVHLLGRRDDMERVFAALDVACLSSRTESFPNVLGEAMACGVPCVATDCSNVREIIRDCGRIVPVGDAAALAGAVLDLLGLDKSTRDAMGSAARARVKADYDIEVVAKRFQEIQRHATTRRWQ